MLWFCIGAVACVLFAFAFFASADKDPRPAHALAKDTGGWGCFWLALVLLTVLATLMVFR